MTKKIVVFFSLLIAGLSLSANEVPQSVAASTGLNFWTSHATMAKVPGANMAVITKTYIINSGQQTVYYVFDIAPAGFVIVSAEDAIDPILGYSFEDIYQENNQPPAFTEWMTQYQQFILQCRTEGRQASSSTLTAWNTYRTSSPKLDTKAVAQLLTTKWDQGTYYNFYCPPHPSGPNGHCVTGCVATAMAQVMKYWNYPETGFDSHSYVHPYYGTLSIDFTQSTFEWADMTNTANATSKFAISELIYNCGVAVDMNYSPTASGSYTGLAADALKNYFHYRSTITVLEKSDYTLFDWRKIIMENLEDGKPLLYSGSGSGGGHAWVCDGYQDTTHFHMNWGWSGANNGYFDLGNLTDFPSGQQIVVNIIPYFEYYCTGVKLMTDESRAFGDGSSFSYYWNDTDCDWLIQPTDATEVVLNFTQFNTEDGKDIVSVYDGNSTSAPLMGTWSGQNMPPMLTSTGGSMLVTFTSDAANQFSGWEAIYTSTIPAGTSENNFSASIEIFPNPAQAELNIRLASNRQEEVLLQVTNITGQIVKWETIPTSVNLLVLDISTLPRGVYALALTGQRDHYRSTFVVE